MTAAPRTRSLQASVREGWRLDTETAGRRLGGYTTPGRVIVAAVVLSAMLFGWFVWPTPYTRWVKGTRQYRENRFTGTTQNRSGVDSSEERMSAEDRVDANERERRRKQRERHTNELMSSRVQQWRSDNPEMVTAWHNDGWLDSRINHAATARVLEKDGFVLAPIHRRQVMCGAGLTCRTEPKCVGIPEPRRRTATRTPRLRRCRRDAGASSTL
jgi:hypothetical protein